MSGKPYLLLIRDGWGYNPDFKSNAVFNAATPNHDRYVAEYPSAFIIASGENVGLPPSNQGSSEVGHLNMGAGRVVYQSLVRISNTIADGTFFKNNVLINALTQAKEKKTTVHTWGLVQDQGVHAHNDHLIALIKLASQLKLPADSLVIHVFGDGRDTPPQSAEVYIREIDAAIQEFGVGRFGSLVGRYYAMDRDNRWERVQLAYDMLTAGKGEGPFDDIYAALQDAYSHDESDEFIKPRLVKGFQPVADGDSVVFFNYRLDRTRELTRAFVEDGFSEFEVKPLKDLHYVCFTEYYEGVTDSSRAAVSVAFPPKGLDHLFGQFLAEKGLRQLRIAETEKFAHVTFFFNGQSDIVFEDEDRVLVPSPKVATYDLQPEMSAFEVRDKAIEKIKSGNYDVIVLNFANPDMVGHTGVYEAALQACEVVDQCVGTVVDAVLEQDGVVFLTSDHGNAEQMQDYVSRKPMTAHTNNLVWFTLVSRRPGLQKDRIRIKPQGGRLADLIPSMLDVMGMEKPEAMDGESLIEPLA